MMFLSTKRQPCRLAVLLLAGTCLAPVGAAAQTWIGGTGTDFATPANWDTGAVPTFNQTGTFGVSGNTQVAMTTSSFTVGGIQFTAAAPSYSFDVNLGGGTMSVAAGGITNLSSNIQNFSLTDTSNFTVNAATSNNINFTLTDSVIRYAGTSNLGNSTVSLTGGSTLVLQGNASGGTAAVTVSSGSFNITLLSGAGTTVGSIAGAGFIALGSKALTVGGNNASTIFSGQITGTGGGSLVKAGTGTLTLTHTNNTYDGGTTINGGTLSISSDANLGAAVGGLTLNASTLQTTASFATSRTTVLGVGSGTFDTATGTTLTHNGTISGAAPTFIKSGDGTLILGGANTFTGVTVVNGGTLQISADNNLGVAGGLILAGGTLRTTSSLVRTRTVSLAGGQGVIDTDGGTTFTQANAISGNGTLVKLGAGTLNLTAANSYTGGTTVSGGTLQGNATSLQGNILNDANVTFDQAGNGIYAGAMSGGGSLTKSGAGTLILSGNNTYSGGTTVSAGILQGNTSSLQGNILNNANVTFDQAGNGIYAGAMSGGGSLTKSGAGTLILSGNNTYSGGTTVSAGILQGNTSSLQGNILNNANVTFDQAGNGIYAGAMSGGGSLTKSGAGTLILSGNNTYGGGTTVSAGILQGNTSSLQGNILNNANVTFDQAGNGIYAGAMSGGGSLIKSGTGTLILSGNNTYGGGTTVSGGTLQGNATSLQGNIMNNASVVFDQAGVGTYAGTMSGAGSLTKTGAGQLTLTGNNSYSGGTTVSGGVLQGTTSSLQGNIVNNAQVTFQQPTTGTYAGNMSGIGSLLVNGPGTLILTGINSYSGGTTVAAGAGSLQGNTQSLQGNILNNASVIFDQANGTYAGVMSGSGGLTVQGGGTLTLTGNNRYAGATTVTGSRLVVNGSLASTVTLDAASSIGGNGSIGGLVSNGAQLAPGNSIGTLTVNGNFSQNGGTYQVEVNPAGQSDRVNVTGTATINGAAVQVLAASGSYGPSTTYTILSAAGGRAGTYAGVTSNFAFLTPSLSYDANNVFLTLALQGNAFSGFGGNTPNQRAVGSALDQSFANASGDFATVIGALAGLSTAQAPAALTAISGEPWADFGTTNVNTGAMFMNTLGLQMALARGGAGTGQRQALAMACEIEACDTARPLSAWFSGLGGLGSVQGGGNASTLTYNFGGAAMGVDYRVTPSLLLGVGVAYTHGTQWVNAFQGQGWTDSVSVAAYGSFSEGGFYADALAGYAYFNNQLQRQLSIPGLQPRTANGSTGANQFLTQVETGYALPVFGAKLMATPFARLQFSTTGQNGFSETGANTLGLSLAQQTTNSLRTVFGAELASAIGFPNQRQLDLALRLGWQHEYASTDRPITAAFLGAPGASFTVYGATPTRDAAIVSFSANTAIAEATQLYLRYDGTLASGTDNHAFTAGLRLSW